MQSNAPQPLSRLGEYEIGRVIATGTMSQIYEARRLGAHGFSRRVALKRILPQLAEDVHFVRMFSDEARVHAGLDHPNLVAVLDFGEDRGELFMTMEFVDGVSLSDLMGLGKRQRRVLLPAALRIAHEILVGLDHVHSAVDADGVSLGIVHRQVAPSNVLLSKSGEVKLTDFGIVRSAALESRTLPGELKGKLGYVSPEQAMGARVDARSDLFSVGVLLAEMLMGEPLFSGRTELEVLTSLHAGDLSNWLRHASEVPPEVHELVRRLLAQRPVERIASARDAADEIDRILHCQPVVMTRAELAGYLSDAGLLCPDSEVQGKRAPAPNAASAPDDARATVPDPPTGPAVSYRVRRPGGTIVGPLTLARVLEMVATARAGLDSEVSRNGGPFLPVAAMAEVAQVAQRPAYRFYDPVALMAQERHALTPSVTPWHFFRAVREKRTGLLCARTPRSQRRFYLLDGCLVASASTEPDELFGSVLVAMGLASASSVDRELERGLRNGKPLGPALVAAGVVRDTDVRAVANEQRLRRLSRVFALSEGELYFVDGARSGETDRTLDPSESLAALVAAVRDGVPDAAVEDLVARMGSEALVPTAGFAALRDGLALDRDETRVIERAARGVSIERLLAEAGTGGAGAAARSRAARALFVALVAGAIGRPKTR